MNDHYGRSGMEDEIEKTRETNKALARWLEGIRRRLSRRSTTPPPLPRRNRLRDEQYPWLLRLRVRAPSP